MPHAENGSEHDAVTHLALHRFSDAVGYAAALHATQLRKSTSVPYIAHLLAVAGLVLEADGDEDMAIAGLLHDAAEDQGGEARLRDVEARSDHEWRRSCAVAAIPSPPTPARRRTTRSASRATSSISGSPTATP